MHMIKSIRRNRKEKIFWVFGLSFFLLLGACQSVPIMNEAGNGAEEITATAVPTEKTATPSPELTETPTPTPTEAPVEDTKSLLGFLQIAVQPVGQTMYVWGGGWNEEDTGAGAEAVTLGVSPAWAEFAAKQDEHIIIRKPGIRFMTAWTAPVMLAGRFTMSWNQRMGKKVTCFPPQRWRRNLPPAAWENIFLQGR